MSRNERLFLTLVVLSMLTAGFWMLEDRLSFGEWVNGWRPTKATPGGRVLFAFTAAFAGGALAWLSLAWYVAGGEGRIAARAVLAVLLAGILCQVFKQSIDRLRPDGGDLHSFPSGHTAGIAAAAVVYLRSGKGPRWMLLAAVVLGALSRVVLGKHFPSDTLGGAVLGTLCALAALRVPLPRKGLSREAVLWLLLAALIVMPITSHRIRLFFAVTAPGIWVVCAAMLVRRRADATGAAP